MDSRLYKSDSRLGTNASIAARRQTRHSTIFYPGFFLRNTPANAILLILPFRVGPTEDFPLSCLYAGIGSGMYGFSYHI
jgi:hypothetical protein